MRDFVVCLIFQQSAIFANYPLSIDRGCTRLVSFSSLTLCKALRSIDFPTCRPEKSLRTHSSPHIVYNYPRQLPSTQRLTWFFSLPQKITFPTTRCTIQEAPYLLLLLLLLWICSFRRLVRLRVHADSKRASL